MEKSIESIWREGFINQDALIAPKVVDLYNRKSKSIVERMTRTLKINIYVLYIMSVGFLAYAIITDIPLIIGLTMFIMFSVPATYSWLQMKKISMLDTKKSSYEYLKDFQAWLGNVFSRSVLLSRFIYPSSIICASLIIWYGKASEEVMEKLLIKFPDMPLVSGVPLYFILAVATISILMIVLTPRIYRWDVGLVYGRQLSKLKEIISDLEELRNSK